MRILLISDIHANLPALDAVLNHEYFDEVLFMGDAVGYGPFPFEVYSRLHQIRATRVLGNHDAAAAFGIDCKSSPEMYEASVITREVITSRRMPKRARQALGKKAQQRMYLDYDGLRLMLIHGSPSNELYQAVSKDEASNLVEQNIDLIILGHTHVAFEVKNGKTWVVNPGSVGMPWDGDPRASYAILDTIEREAHIERLNYDPEPVISLLRKLLFDHQETYEFLANIFRTGRKPVMNESS